MAYPTWTLSRVLARVDDRVMRIKTRIDAVHAASLAGDVPSSRILELYTQLRADHAELSTLTSTPGLATYAQEQKNDSGLNIATEFTAMLDQLTAVTTWINANFPKDANGFLLAQTLGPNGPVDRMFTTVQLAAFRTQLEALAATII